MCALLCHLWPSATSLSSRPQRASGLERNRGCGLLVLGCALRARSSRYLHRRPGATAASQHSWCRLAYRGGRVADPAHVTSGDHPAPGHGQPLSGKALHDANRPRGPRRCLEMEMPLNHKQRWNCAGRGGENVLESNLGAAGRANAPGEHDPFGEAGEGFSGTATSTPTASRE